MATSACKLLQQYSLSHRVVSGPTLGQLLGSFGEDATLLRIFD